VTGLLAVSHTREAAWQAMWERRVCGTTGPRMLIEFWVNGAHQGSEIIAGSAHVTGHVLGTAGLELVELVKFDSGGYRAVWQGGGSGPRVPGGLAGRRLGAGVGDRLGRPAPERVRFLLHPRGPGRRTHGLGGPHLGRPRKVKRAPPGEALFISLYLTGSGPRACPACCSRWRHMP